MRIFLLLSCLLLSWPVFSKQVMTMQNIAASDRPISAHYKSLAKAPVLKLSEPVIPIENG